MIFQEIGGSPKEQYDRDGFSSQRDFLIPWENRREFAARVFGTAAIPSNSDLLTYPGKNDTVAVRLKMEPLDPNAISQEPLGDLRVDLARYDGSFLKATVYYESVAKNDSTNLPTVSSGSWITYKMIIGSVEEELSLSAWKWSDNGSISVESDRTGIKRIPITEHHLTWNHVVDPQWPMIQQIQGKINSVAFLGCDPGTLLFDGAEGNKLYRKGDTVDDMPSSYTWQIRFVFREKAIKSGGQVFGWNHFYRSNPAGWIPLVFNQSPMYDSADFSTLFK